MKKKFFATLFLTGGSLLTFGQSFDRAKMDSYFDALEKNERFMGNVALSQNGKLVYTRSVGYSDLAKQTKADASTRYRIGSISKTFTAVLVMKAVEENKLTLDQTIAEYFPKIKNAEKITIKHLLSHRSGIPNFTDADDYFTWNVNPITEAAMIAKFVKSGSDFEPDSKADYSNSNYMVLTYILEKIYKQSYAALLKKYITQPLGLTNTYLGGKINTAKGEALSYQLSQNKLPSVETDISVTIGAGGIVSTAADLTQFSDGLFGGKLLKPQSLAQMKTLRDAYGYGLVPIPFYSHQGFGHTGAIDGFTSVFAHFDQGNLSYALTSNGTLFNNNNISIAVLSACYGVPYEIPEFKEIAADEADLSRYPGLYASQQIPLKLNVTTEGKTVYIQVTGQSRFPLEATGKHAFKFEQVGVVIEFTPEKNTLVLKQNGGVYHFVKE